MINWISKSIEVPTNRREVLVWGYTIPNFGRKPSFLGTTRYNRNDLFDIEKNNTWISYVVTHWADIGGPTQ
ncbi:MAG: hypothetical protein BWY21_00089 [Parcubacteria group bacterium ADurb.Bin216]|nr:MAG: hypothetical protein BWY21_00089 [Parcubacteria group bacterium ADurb.Bin216]